MPENDNLVSAVERAADILEYLYDRRAECSIASISKDLGLYKSRVHRLLQTLKSRGYVYQNPITLRYGLGLRLFLLGSRVEQNTGIVELIKPIAKELVQKYNECVHMTIPYPATNINELPKQLLIGKIMNPNNVLTVSPPTGTTAYCHSSASGKCILAYSSEEQLEKIHKLKLIKFTENTITSWDKLDRQLAEVREKGFSTEDGETELGLSCTASPVITRTGLLTLVLSVSGPTSRIRSLPQDELIADLKAATEKIAIQLT